MKTITRRIIRDLGANSYQAVQITKSLPIKNIKKSTYFYNTKDVVISIETYLEKKRIKEHTKKLLLSIKDKILSKYKITNFKSKKSKINIFYNEQKIIEEKIKTVEKMIKSSIT